MGLGGEGCVNWLINRRQNGVLQRTQVAIAILGIPTDTTNKDTYTYTYIRYDILKIFEPGTNVIKFSYSGNLMKMCGVLQVAIG